MNYNIPKKLQFGGQIIKVKVLKTVEKEGAVGCYYSLLNEIHIQTHVEGAPMPVEKVEQIFWHEYAHALTDSCRDEDLCANEPLIDLMGEFLYQSLGKLKWK